MLNRFGGKSSTGDQYVFDSRGAIRITDKQITKRNGEIVKIRSIADAGSGTSMVMDRPTGGNGIDPSRAMEAYHGWPYAALKAIADVAAEIEWRVFRIQKNGDLEELETHDILDFLESVNDFQVGPEFKHIVVDHLGLTGNAYILLLGKGGMPVKSYEELPHSMYLLDPSKVKVILNKVRYPYSISKYRFSIDAHEYNYEPYQVVQIKLPNPSNPYLGLGIVQGIAEWIDNDNNATEFLRQFFANGAQIGVTFETDMSSEEQLQELRDSFNEQHSGVQNAYKAMFLPKGVKKPTNDVKFDDLGMDTVSDTNRDKILAGFRVPKTILGAAESDTNRSTAETADYVFAKRTVKPMMRLICAYLNEFLVPRFAPDIFLTFIDPVPEDKLTKSQELRNIIGSLPVITADEARAEYLDLPAIQGGDKLLAPNNYVPAIDAGTVPNYSILSAKPVETKTKKGKTLRLGYVPTRTMKGRTQFSRNLETRKEVAKSMSEKILDVIKGIKMKTVDEMTDNEYEEGILKEKRARTSKYSDEIKAELRKINDAQMKEVDKNLGEAIKAIDPTKLFDLEKWINITVSAITPIAMRFFKKEADHALDVIGAPGLDVAGTPSAKTAMTKAMSLMAQSYNQDTLDILEAKLTEGLKQGFGVQKLGELVSDIYTWKDTYAAERVALTESNRITNEAGKMAWKESGRVKEIKWVTAGSDVCTFCQAQDGKTIDIDDNFFDKGDTIEGEDGAEMDADYSDIGGPPLHPNCRCGIKPILSKKIQTADILGKEAEIDAALAQLDILTHEQKT